ncbi:MAG TPA: hypothetical protein VHJ20_08855 [Polyangia bacterium]|nr:hypothetical protein [Polyangia bacterium]
MKNLRLASLTTSLLALALAAGCSSSGTSEDLPGTGGSLGSPGSTSTGSDAPAAPTGSGPIETPSTGGGAFSGATTGTGGVTGAGGATSSAGGSLGVGGVGDILGGPSPTPSQAQLTAGTWDDNLNFDFYQTYLTNMAQLDGAPLIDRANRLEITVSAGPTFPLAGARVTVSDAQGKLFSSTTRGDGKLFFFPGTVGATPGTELTLAISYGGQDATITAHVGDTEAGVQLFDGWTAPAPTLDLALVVDTTGSMGDELAFLQREMAAILGQVSRDFPGVAQRWSAIFYRDTQDEYVVRTFDFTSSIDTIQTELAAQSAAGGGDLPEAPDQALAKLSTLSWRPDSVARMAFWIADAPHHAAQATTMAQDILTAHGLGIRIYPIAASGTDDLLEYTMRTAAEVTGGRYLFLTNDSGIGGDHKEPTIPCYTVTTLHAAMMRMIDMELTGTDAQPAPADVIRTAGHPVDGRCTTDSGEVVTIL